jgi:ATP-dependent DNA helicase RecQ
LKLTDKSDDVLKGKEKVMLAKAKERIEIMETETSYETELFQRLKAFRYQLAIDENVAAFQVLSDATLRELATFLPLNKEEFSKISGFGEIKLEKYGKKFAEVVFAYCKENSLTSRIHLKNPKRIRKIRIEHESDTKQRSFEMFSQGNSIAKIAETRKLSLSTIENHLAFYVQKGKLKIEELIDVSKIPAIKNAIVEIGGVALTPIKQQLGDSFSYGEIRLVMAHLAFLSSEGEHLTG